MPAWPCVLPWRRSSVLGEIGEFAAQANAGYSCVRLGVEFEAWQRAVKGLAGPRYQHACACVRELGFFYWGRPSPGAPLGALPLIPGANLINFKSPLVLGVHTDPGPRA